jgi:hypothetical protein
MSEFIVDGFLKNAREMVVGELSDFQGKQYAHIRIMVPAADGEWIRTAKGVAVEAGRASELQDAIRKLLDVAATDRVVARIPLGSKREIRVGVQPFRGDQYVYVRTYVSTDEGWHPTEKGIHLRTERLNELVDLVDRLVAAIGKTGEG